MFSKGYNQYTVDTQPTTGQVCEEFSFWSPRGQIWAAASYLRDLRAYVISVEELGKDAKKHRYPVDNLLMSDLRDPFWVHRARYTVAMYNKGPFAVQRAVDAFYQVNAVLPRDFGPAWELLKEPRWSNYEFKAVIDKLGRVVRPARTWALSADSFRIGKCHIYKVAGLCGERPDGYLADYEGDFAFDMKTAQWYRLPAKTPGK